VHEPERGRRILAFVKVSSIRFMAFYFVAFYGAIEVSGAGAVRVAALGALLWCVSCAGIELTNRYADRVEDEINRPERTALCKLVGYTTIGKAAFGIQAALLVLYLAWFAAARKVDLFAVQMASWLLGWGYSVGPRLKARRYGVLVALSCTFVLPFLFGFAVRGRLVEAPLAPLCVPAFVISLSGVKDITDVAGDAERGYRSLFVDLAERRSGRALLALLASPYLLIAVLVLAGAAPARFLSLLLLAPGSLLFAVLVRGGRGPEETASVRESLYHFWFVFLAATMALLCPTKGLLAALASAAVFWVVATRKLHWATGLTREQFLAVTRILMRAGSERHG
jgi:4-hydroxybenzoate polyprenyltransferase